MDIHQTAELLMCSTAKVRRLLLAGQLKGSSIGGTQRRRWRILESDVYEYLKGSQEPVKPAQAAPAKRAEPTGALADFLAEMRQLAPNAYGGRRSTDQPQVRA